MNTLAHVLVLDDDQVNNFICESIILKTGFAEKVTSFLEAQSCLDFLKGLETRGEKAPELIFLDISMPDMNGWSFLEEIDKHSKEEGGKIPIVMLTSSIYKNDKSRSMAYENVIEFITKPISKKSLEDLMENRFLNLA